jgi:lysophospholipase L1-like esterase
MKRWAVAALALAAALIGLELWARAALGPRFVQGAWVGPPQAICGRFDPELGWFNREGSRARIAGRGGAYTVTINAQGLRGPERGYAKPSGTLRVLLLGDSTGWGWGVGDEEGFARQVEQRLGPHVEVINLSVPGYSTDQELLALEREGVRYAPDLVLLALVLNDLVGNNHPEFHGMQKPFFDVRDGELALSNVPLDPPPAASDLASRYALRRASTCSALVKRLLPKPPEYVRPNLEDPAVQAGIARHWDLLSDPASRASLLLAQLQARCEALDAPLVAFVLPHLHDRYLYDPEAPRPASVPEGTALTQGSLRLGEAGQRLGFRVFSVDRALYDAVRQGNDLDCGDEHLNARGNRIVADVVAAELAPLLAELRPGS